MSHTFLARSAAAAAVIGMLSVSAPAFAQSTQGTQDTTTTSNATQSMTTKNPQACKNGKPINPPPSQAQQSNATGKAETVCKADMKKYKGMVKTNQSGQASPNAGVSPTNVTPTTGTMPTTGTAPAVPVTTPVTTPETAPATTNTTTTVAPSTNANQGTMTNALTDNPNGANWLAKYNRPAVAQRYRRSRTHALGTTTNSGQPPR